MFEESREYGFGAVRHCGGSLFIDKTVPKKKRAKIAMEWFVKFIGESMLEQQLVEIQKTDTAYHFHVVFLEPKQEGLMSAKSEGALEMAALCRKKREKNG